MSVCVSVFVRAPLPSSPSAAPQLHPAPAGAAAAEPEKEKSALADMFYVSQTETAAGWGETLKATCDD